MFYNKFRSIVPIFSTRLHIDVQKNKGTILTYFYLGLLLNIQFFWCTIFIWIQSFGYNLLNDVGWQRNGTRRWRRWKDGWPGIEPIRLQLYMWLESFSPLLGREIHRGLPTWFVSDGKWFVSDRKNNNTSVTPQMGRTVNWFFLCRKLQEEEL